jgi:hypothetical protein
MRRGKRVMSAKASLLGRWSTSRRRAAQAEQVIDRYHKNCDAEKENEKVVEFLANM